MTISAEIPELIATAAPGQTVFAFDFRLFQPGDIDVFVDRALATYTPAPTILHEYDLIILALPAEGGSITFGDPMVGGEVVEIFRAVPIERATNFPPSGPVPMDAINLEFDRHIAIMQDLDADVDRITNSALRVPPPETIGPLPPKETRAQGILGFDANGEPIILPSEELGSVAVVAQRREVVAVAGQTTFQTNAVYTVGFVSVYVNGVRLSEQEYVATDGINVVLDEPCLAGDIVVLEGFLGSPTAGSTNDLTFIQAGTGAISRNAQDKMRERVSAADFGAIGNGVANDRAALQAALNAVSARGGGAVWIDPAKRYLIDDGDLIVPNYCGIVGDSSLPGQSPVDGSPGTYQYDQVPNAIVLNPAYTIKLGSSAWLRGFAIMRKGIPPTANLRQGMDAIRAFAGTAITINGQDTTVEKLFVMGFDLLYSSGFSRNHVNHVQGDNNRAFLFTASRDTTRVNDCHFWPYQTGNRGYTATFYTITTFTNNGAGLVRVTVNAPHELATGDNVSITDYNGTNGGLSNAAVYKQWGITVINATSFDLVGSVWNAAFTGLGGRAYAADWARPGPVFDLRGPSESFVLMSNQAFGYRQGTKIGDQVGWVSSISNAFDDVLETYDPDTIAIWLLGNAYACSFVGGWTGPYGHPLVMQGASLAAHMFSAMEFSEPSRWQTGAAQVLQIIDGGATFSSCTFRTGLIYIANAADNVRFGACDFNAATFSYEGATASSKTWINGVRGHGALVIGGADTYDAGTAQLFLNATNRNGIFMSNMQGLTGFTCDSTPALAYFPAQYRQAGVGKGAIFVDTTGTQFQTTSDYRLKDVAGAITTSGAFIDALKPCRGTWKHDGSPFAGFLAHEFQEVSPGSVSGTKDQVDGDGNPMMQGMQASTSEVIANIVAELQSLRTRVATVENIPARARLKKSEASTQKTGKAERKAR